LINLAILSEAAKSFAITDFPFLAEQSELLAANKPFKGLRVFHNIPLTLSTIVKIQALILGGAEVTVGGVNYLDAHHDALEILYRAKVKIDLEKTNNEQFDVHLDCGAELLGLMTPTFGTCELTQTGSYRYQHETLVKPIISVNDSKIKSLEAVGTGDGFVRAFKNLTGENIAKKRFMVFGFGKIGRGIVYALLKHTNDVIVVEKNVELLALAEKLGLTAFNFQDVNAIKRNLKQTLCAVTATGAANCISAYFDKADFYGVYLANMGVLDEFGDKFDESDVLYNKVAINFSNKEPTFIRYLDPIFFAHNHSIHLFFSNQLAAKYHVFPADLSEKIVNQWKNHHGEFFNDFPIF